MLITGKVLIQNLSDDPNVDLDNININQFYEVFPAELRASHELEASTIIRLCWGRRNPSVTKGNKIYFYCVDEQYLRQIS
jgi:hypothetical protein